MSPPRVRDAGDAALLLELEPVIDARVNALAIAIADRIRTASMDGVLDVLATFRSVAVYFDPAIADRAAIRRALTAAVEIPAAPGGGREIEVPVVYGGEAGPDLPALAVLRGLSEADVVALHAGRPYRVFMLGFLPGFPYMGSVDDRIAAPRQPTPRARVAAGSVGIAGAQTGIYPSASPGGWQIIGRTSVELFNPARSPAALFSPGDTVRFVPVSAAVVDADVGAASRRPDMGRLKPAPTLDAQPAPGLERILTVISPGLFTTVQDRGRWGHQSLGVPVAGPMDVVSHDAANSALGNDPASATLEVTLSGPEVRFEHGAWVVVTGANLGATLDGVALAPGVPRAARTGSLLRFGERRRGARAYVAVDGGIAAPLVLGSRATHVAGGIGRALAAGDRLALGTSPQGAPRPVPQIELPSGGARLRVRRGPQDDGVPAPAMDLLHRSRFHITPQSNRMAYRLSGPRLTLPPDAGMISDATFTGGIQVPPSGEPILLMADRQTTGGYPQVATLVAADIPRAGQLAPGDWIEFELWTDRDAAR